MQYIICTKYISHATRFLYSQNKGFFGGEWLDYLWNELWLIQHLIVQNEALKSWSNFSLVLFGKGPELKLWQIHETTLINKSIWHLWQIHVTTLEKSMYQYWQMHVTNQRNPLKHFDKSIWLHKEIHVTTLNKLNNLIKIQQEQWLGDLVTRQGNDRNWVQ